MLEFDGEILGKPFDDADAVRRWRRMRGHAGTLHTGHCVVELGQRGDPLTGVASTTVHFADISDEEIARLCGYGRARPRGRRVHDRRLWRVVRGTDRRRRRHGHRCVAARATPPARRGGSGRDRPVGGWTTVDYVSFKSIGLSDDLHAYLIAHNPPADPLVTELLAETRAALPAHGQYADRPGAGAVPDLPDPAARVAAGRRDRNLHRPVVACDRPWAAARRPARLLRHLCRVHVDRSPLLAAGRGRRTGSSCGSGPAAETLATLPDEPHLDIAFIDADKTGYPMYWDDRWCPGCGPAA